MHSQNKTQRTSEREMQEDRKTMETTDTKTKGQNDGKKVGRTNRLYERQKNKGKD